MLFMIWLNTLPIAGPSRARMTITTIATKTRINAYSTRPWPFSLGANNMTFHLLSILVYSNLLRAFYIIVSLKKNAILLTPKLPFNYAKFHIRSIVIVFRCCCRQSPCTPSLIQHLRLVPQQAIGSQLAFPPPRHYPHPWYHSSFLRDPE